MSSGSSSVYGYYGTSTSSGSNSNSSTLTGMTSIASSTGTVIAPTDGSTEGRPTQMPVMSSEVFRTELQSMISLMNGSSPFNQHEECSINNGHCNNVNGGLSAMLPASSPCSPQAQTHCRNYNWNYGNQYPYNSLTAAGARHRRTYDFFFNPAINSGGNAEQPDFQRQQENNVTFTLPRRHSYANPHATTSTNFMQYRLAMAKKRDFV